MGRSKRASASHGGAQGAAASAPSMATGTQFSTAGHIDTGKRRASRNGAVVFAIVKALGAARLVAKRGDTAEKAAAPKCPYCLEDVAEGATRCPHCTAELPEPAGTSRPSGVERAGS